MTERIFRLSVVILLALAPMVVRAQMPPERKAARLRYLRNRWMERVGGLRGVNLLTPSDPAQSCALGAMNIDGMGAQALTDRLLADYRIHVRPRFVTNEWEGIRITPNVFTTLGEVDAFGEAIERIVAGA